MLPTLQDEDYLITESVSLITSTPSYGDIVTLEADNKFLIKRVVGLGGDVIEFIPSDVNSTIDAHILLNGEVLKEPYILEEMEIPFQHTVTVPEGSVYVLGDNRNNSLDSRYYGAFPLDKIKGTVFLELKNDFKFY